MFFKKKIKKKSFSKFFFKKIGRANSASRSQPTLVRISEIISPSERSKRSSVGITLHYSQINIHIICTLLVFLILVLIFSLLVLQNIVMQSIPEWPTVYQPPRPGYVFFCRRICRKGSSICADCFVIIMGRGL